MTEETRALTYTGLETPMTTPSNSSQTHSAPSYNVGGGAHNSSLSFPSRLTGTLSCQ